MPTCILDLPRDLRHKIYELCRASEGGYFFYPPTRRFRDINNQPPDLALTFVCKQITSETKGIALAVNSLTFKTWCPDDPEEQERMKLFQKRFMAYNIQRLRLTSFGFSERRLKNCYYPRIASFPHFEWSQAEHPLWINNSGEPDSLFRDILDTAHVEFLDESRTLDSKEAASVSAEENPMQSAISSLKKLMKIDLQPWDMYTKEDFATLLKATAPLNWALEGLGTEDDQPVAYSAAAMAIQYLSTCRLRTRRQHHSFILHEDRPSICMPECHAVGLISYRRENPKLRINRCVDLWRNVFAQAAVRASASGSVSTNTLHSTEIIDSIAPWIMEAHALEPLGMLTPTSSFSLLLDGSADPVLANEAMRVVIRYTAMQKNLASIHNGLPNNEFKEPLVGRPPQPPSTNSSMNLLGDVSPPCLDDCVARLSDWPRRFQYRDFPLAVDELNTGTPLVRCNFDIRFEWTEQDEKLAVEEGFRLQVPDVVPGRAERASWEGMGEKNEARGGDSGVGEKGEGQEEGPLLRLTRRFS